MLTQGQIGHDPQKVLKETDSMKSSLSESFSEESSPPLLRLLKATGIEWKERSNSAVASSYSAPNALLPSNVYVSEKTLDGCVGKCLGTSALAMLGACCSQCCAFPPKLHWQCLPEPPLCYFPLLQLSWCCWSHAFHRQSPVVLLWQVWTLLVHLCVCESTSTPCVTQLSGCQNSL